MSFLLLAFHFVFNYARNKLNKRQKKAILSLVRTIFTRNGNLKKNGSIFHCFPIFQTSRTTKKLIFRFPDLPQKKKVIFPISRPPAQQKSKFSDFPTFRTRKK